MKRLTGILLFVCFSCVCNAGWHDSPYRHFPRIQVAYSVTEAMMRPTVIRELFVWDLTPQEIEQIPKLINLEYLTFGDADMEGINNSPPLDFPVAFCHLPKLKVIYILNSTGVFPDELGQLKSLRKISSGFVLPSSISLLDSLEEVCAPISPQPLPGNFKGLKRMRYSYNALLFRVAELPSLQELDLYLPPDSIRCDSILLAVAKHKNIQMLRVYGTSNFPNAQVQSLFNLLDQLPKLHELSIEGFGFSGINTSFPNLHCDAFGRINKLTCYSPIDFRFLGTQKLKRLETLVLECSFFAYGKVQLVPEHFFPFLPSLKEFTCKLGPGYEKHSETCINYFLADVQQTRLESFSLYTTEYNHYCTSDDPFTPIAPLYIKQYQFPNLYAFLSRQKQLNQLTLAGFALPELQTISTCLEELELLIDINVQLLAQDGKPFTIKNCEPYQQRTWILLRDEAATCINNNWTNLHPDTNIVWKLLTIERPFHGQYAYEPIQSEYDPIKRRFIYSSSDKSAFSDVPLIVWTNDSLPFYLRFSFPNPNDESFEFHPTILSTNRYQNRIDYQHYWFNYEIENYIDNVLSHPIHDSSQHGEAFEYYANGIPKVYKTNELEMRWTKSGCMIYFRLDKRMEFSWDTLGCIQRVRLDVSGRTAELRFGYYNVLLAEGWLNDKMRPVGTWYYFTPTQEVKTGKSPRALRRKN